MHLCVLAVLVTVYIEAWAVVGNNFPTMRLLLREGWLDSGFLASILPAAASSTAESHGSGFAGCWLSSVSPGHWTMEHNRATARQRTAVHLIGSRERTVVVRVSAGACFSAVQLWTANAIDQCIEPSKSKRNPKRKE